MGCTLADHIYDHAVICKNLQYRARLLPLNSTSCTLIIIRLVSMLIFDTPYIKNLRSARKAGFNNVKFTQVSCKNSGSMFFWVTVRIHSRLKSG